MAVSKRTRYEVLRRDNHACRYCGASAPDVRLVVDHVTPVALGGSDKPDNLVAACQDCNAGKTSTTPGAPLVEDVKALDLKWAGAIKRAHAIRAADRRKRATYIRAWGAEWESYGLRIPNDAWQSVERLYEAGLPKAELLDVTLIAATNRGVYDRFSYFMGICWKRVREIQETATQLLAADEEAGA